MQVSLHRAARAELVEATDYYRLESADLATRFGAQVTKSLIEIGNAPFRWRVFQGEWRKYLVDRFPYSITR